MKLALLFLLLPTLSLAVSPNGACIGPAPCSAISLTDSAGNAWTIVAGVVYQQAPGKAAVPTVSQQVIELEYANGLIYQENVNKNWWDWVNGAWVATTAPVIAPPVATYSAVITWTAPTIDANGNPVTLTGFNIYQGTSPSTLAKIASVGPTVTTYTATNLPAGQLYFGVTAVDAQGESQLVSPLPAVPESVLNLSVIVGTVVP